MPKFIVGFVLGVVVTIAVMQWLGEPEGANGQTTADPASPADAGRGRSLVQSEEPSREWPEAPAANDGQEPGPGTADDAMAVSDDLAGQSPANPATTRRPNSANVTAETRAQGSAGDNSYPPEIEEMIENHVDKDLQEQFENDEREDSWAPYMEGMLAEYLAQKPEIAQFYISLIECRTSMCSVHAVGYGTDALTQWNVATADLVEQPWFDFKSMSMNRHNPVADVLGIVMIVTRDPST